MKKYMLFAGSYYYPLGGMNDLVECFASYEEAEEAFQSRSKEAAWDWYEIENIDNYIER